MLTEYICGCSVRRDTRARRCAASLFPPEAAVCIPSAETGRVRPCEPLCELLWGWVESQPLQGFLRRFSGAFYGSSEDESRSRINTRRQARRPVRSLLPAVRAVTGFFGEFQSGVKIEGVLSLLRSLSPKAYTHKKKVGVMPRKGAHFEQERKICPLSHP